MTHDTGAVRLNSLSAFPSLARRGKWVCLCVHYLRSLLVGFRGGDELGLHAVDAVDAVDEQNENEDETNLHPILNLGYYRVLGDETVFMVRNGCSIKTGVHFREGGGVGGGGVFFCEGICTYVKILRLTLKGRGMMRSMNMPISSTRRANT